MNNKVDIHHIESSRKVDSIDYLNSIKNIIVTGNYVAALYANKLEIKEIGQNNGKHIIFPPDRDAYNVTALSGSNGYIYFGTDDKNDVIKLQIFSTEDFSLLDGCSITHTNKINNISVNNLGTRVIFVDDKSVYLYVPATKSLTLVPYEHTANIKILWDSKDDGGFCIKDGDTLHSFIFTNTSIHGEYCYELGNVNISDSGEVIIKPQATLLPAGSIPITCFDGLITCQAQNGTIEEVKLHSHDKILDDRPTATGAFYQLCFQQNLALLRLQEAWQVAVKLKSKKSWFALGNKSMEILDIDMAIKVYFINIL